MNRKARFRTTLTAVSILTLISMLGCFCWPSLPSLIHRGGCASLVGSQPSAANGQAGVIPPPRPKIVYIHEGDVWIMNQDGKEKKQLTDTPQREFSPSFARNTEKIWYVRQTTGEGGTVFGDVFSSDLMGKNVEQVTEGINVRFAAVSIDGKKLAVSVGRTVDGLAANGQAGETADMWIMDAERKMQTADGEHVDLSGDLPFTPGMGRDGATYLAWSPMMDRVAFTYKSDGSASLGISTTSIYTAAPDGADRKELVKSAQEPCFDGQGTEIAFVTGAHWDTMGVGFIDAAGGTAETVLPVAPGTADGTLLYSAYTPFWMTTFEDISEQKNLVYSKTTHPAEPGISVNTLEGYNTDSRQTTVLATQEGGGKAIRRASPEFYSNQIVFQVGAPDFITEPNASIWTVKTDGTGLKRVAEGPDDSEPVWALDNSWWRGGGGSKANKCHWPYEDQTIRF